jgi:hypothetical protein
MSKKEYFEFHRQFCDKMIAITAAKNNDYAGFEDDNPFANFTVVERSGIASTEQGFLTRMMDKMSRINTFVKKGVLSVEDEKIEDTLCDLANYSVLLAGYIKSKRDAAALSLSRATVGIMAEDKEEMAEWHDVGGLRVKEFKP